MHINFISANARGLHLQAFGMSAENLGFGATAQFAGIARRRPLSGQSPLRLHFPLTAKIAPASLALLCAKGRRFTSAARLQAPSRRNRLLGAFCGAEAHRAKEPREGPWHGAVRPFAPARMS